MQLISNVNLLSIQYMTSQLKALRGDLDELQQLVDEYKSQAPAVEAVPLM